MTRIYRAYIEQTPNIVGEEVALPETEAIHLSRVLRFAVGDNLEALDGRGGRFAAECIEVNKNRAKIRILKLHHEPLAFPEFRMGIALGKGNKWEELIRPLTELGITRLTPLLTERTEVSFRLSKFADKKERWQKIAREACKQSGNPWVPKFDDPILIGDVLSQMDNGDDCWIASLQHRTANLLPKQGSKCITLFIGPEGGWSIEEENMARELNLSFFSLGPHVLRLETAAISALAVARQHLLC